MREPIWHSRTRPEQVEQFTLMAEQLGQLVIEAEASSPSVRAPFG